MAKRSMTAAEPVTRTRRSEEQRIAELEAKIVELKRRAEVKKIKRDPGLRHVSIALRSIDKALASTEDGAMRGALDEARATLAACVQLNGGKADRGTLIPQRRRAGPAVEPEVLLAFIQQHPGSRGEQIAAELGTDTTSMRPLMHRLIDERKVRTKGQRRGMTYHPV
jgi:hypothetical protein